MAGRCPVTRRDQIAQRLTATFAPAHLEVVDESGGHSVAPGSESHFKVVLASGHFTGLSLVARHRLVYQALAEHLEGGVHALALHTYSSTEWNERGAAAPVSPRCRGGMSGAH